MSARRQDVDGDRDEQALAVLLHGDAAFAGEGIVAETLNLSQLARLHDRRHDSHHRQQSARLHHAARRGPLVDSTATDIAKMIQAPIFHVNSDDVGSRVTMCFRSRWTTGRSLRRTL